MSSPGQHRPPPARPPPPTQAQQHPASQPEREAEVSEELFPVPPPRSQGSAVAAPRSAVGELDGVHGEDHDYLTPRPAEGTATEDSDDDLLHEYDFVDVPSEGGADIDGHESEVEAAPLTTQTPEVPVTAPLTQKGYLAMLRDEAAHAQLFWIDVLTAARAKHGQDEPPVADVPEKASPNYSSKLLMSNMQRLRTATEPFFQMAAQLRILASWHRPVETGFCLCLYIFGCYNQLLVPLALAWILVLLLRGYLRHEGYLPKATPAKTEKDDALAAAASGGFKIWEKVKVVRKIQNGTGEVADALERVINLFTWAAPLQTSKIATGVAILLGAWLLLPTWIIIQAAEIYLGYRFFVIEAIYINFPEVRRKYASSIIDHAPTNAMIKQAAQSRVDGAVPAGAAMSATSVRETRSGSLPEPRLRTRSTSSANDATNSPGKQRAVAPKTSDNQLQRLIDLGLPATAEVLHSWGCLWLENGNFKTARKGRLFLAEGFTAFLRSNPEESGSFVMPLNRLMVAERGKTSFMGLGVLFELVFSTPSGVRETRVFTGLASIENMIALFNEKALLCKAHTD